MRLAASQTQQSEEAVQMALADRQRREAQKRKEIEEKERRERELQAKLRLKRLEEQKREQERLERQRREREAREREIQKREEAQRDALRYGPKAGKSGYPGSAAGKRRHSASSDDDSTGQSNALTREEKRQRRLEAELRGSRGASMRRSGGGGYSKAGRKLPGGAVDITTTKSSSSASPSQSQSIRERLAAEPSMLIKLNTNKRDTRTIDEILQDRAKLRQGKVLDGESAKEFNDWFGKSKKDPPKKSTPSTSRANTPAVAGSSTGSQSKAASGSASPGPVASKSQPSQKTSTTPAKSISSKTTSTSKPPAPKASTNAKSAVGASRPLSATPKSSSLSAHSKPIPKKRRSPSSSVSPPPARRRPAPGGPANDISSEIWKLFGKDRSSYIQRDVFSDDEDMEADAFDVEREELRRFLQWLCPTYSFADVLLRFLCSLVRDLRRRKTSWRWKKNAGMRRRSGDARRRRRSVAITETRVQEAHTCASSCVLWFSKTLVVVFVRSDLRKPGLYQLFLLYPLHYSSSPTIPYTSPSVLLLLLPLPSLCLQSRYSNHIAPRLPPSALPFLLPHPFTLSSSLARLPPSHMIMTPIQTQHTRIVTTVDVTTHRYSYFPALPPIVRPRMHIHIYYTHSAPPATRVRFVECNMISQVSRELISVMWNAFHASSRERGTRRRRIHLTLVPRAREALVERTLTLGDPIRGRYTT